MGKTVPPFSRVVDDFFSGYRRFRSNLDEPERAAFDQIELSAQMHALECVYAAFVEPFHAIALSTVVDMKVRVDDLEARLERAAEVMRLAKGGVAN
jgi:hypothetical protein